MAKSSYEYAANAMGRPETEEERAVREAVAAAFEESGGTYGYRRLLPEVNDILGFDVGEWTVRKIMREQGLVACAPRRKRRYSSYAGEVSEAPENTCLDERGRHHFAADKPNGLWVTDITEFRIPASKCHLSPVTDRFDGMPIGWPSARPRTRSLPTPRSCGYASSSGMVSTPGCTATAAATIGGPVGSASATSAASCARCRGRGAHPTIQGRRASSAG